MTESPTPEQLVATHEAGHTIAGLCQGRRIIEVSVFPNKGSIARTLELEGEKSYTLRQELLFLLAATSAEVHLCGSHDAFVEAHGPVDLSHNDSDGQRAVRLLAAAGLTRSAEKELVVGAAMEARQLIELYWQDVELLTTTLLQRVTIIECELQRMDLKCRQQTAPRAPVTKKV